MVEANLKRKLNHQIYAVLAYYKLQRTNLI